MKSKNVAYLLITGSLLWILLAINMYIYNLVKFPSDHLFKMSLDFLLTNIPSVGFTWIGFSLLRENKLPGKNIGIIFAVASALFFGLKLYNGIFYFSADLFRSNKLSFVLDYLRIIFPLSMFIFWLMFLARKVEKGAAWLLVGAIFTCITWFTGKLWLVALVFSRYGPFNDSWAFGGWIAGNFDLLYPLSLVIFSFFLLRKQKSNDLNDLTNSSQGYSEYKELLDEVVENPETTTQPIQKEQQIPSVLDWLSDFLLAMIPLFGWGFLFWRGQNSTDRYRRNWAIATLFWTALGFSFLSYLYAPLWLRFESHDAILVILLLLILILFSIAAGLSSKATRDDEDMEAEYLPSVSTWFGRGFLLSLPLVGLILLIVWAVDEEDKAKKKWAVANMLRMAITLVYYFSMYVAYSNILQFAGA